MTIDQTIYFAIAVGFYAGDLHLQIAKARFLVSSDLADVHTRTLLDHGWSIPKVQRLKTAVGFVAGAFLSLAWPVVLFIRLHKVLFRRIGIRQHYVELVTCERCKTRHGSDLHGPAEDEAQDEDGQAR